MGVCLGYYKLIAEINLDYILQAYPFEERYCVKIIVVIISNKNKKRHDSMR